MYVILAFGSSPSNLALVDVGIVICFSYLHPWKTSDPISATEAGIEICVNDEHS